MTEVYAQLREELLSGAFEPDRPISQIKLAHRLGISRTPLREALRMLQRDRLISSEPNRQVRARRSRSPTSRSSTRRASRSRRSRCESRCRAARAPTSTTSSTPSAR